MSGFSVNEPGSPEWERREDALEKDYQIPEDVNDPDYVAPETFFCDYCGNPFVNLGDKFRHIATSHKSEPAPTQLKDDARDIIDL